MNLAPICVLGNFSPSLYLFGNYLAQTDLEDIQRSIILQELISYSVGQRTLLSSGKFNFWDESNRPRKINYLNWSPSNPVMTLLVFPQ